MTPDAISTDTYSTREAARVLGSSPSWVRGQAAKGNLAGYRIGSHWRIYVSAVHALKVVAAEREA